MPPRLTAAAALLLLGWARTAPAFIEGFAYPVSVVQGDSVSFFVSTDAVAFDIVVDRIGARDVRYRSVVGLPGAVQAAPESGWAGCDWTPTVSLPVPEDWPSGVYVARFVPDGSVTAARGTIFTVVEDEPGSTARVLLQNSVATWQAYNAWGGKSLYNEQSQGGQRAYAVSFRRPQVYNQGVGAFRFWEEPLVRWIEGEGIAVEYCTDLDTHGDPALLPSYEMLIIAGHDEYWSKEMRDRVESWNAAGGRVAILGGNTCWWQVRFEPFPERVVCYKAASLDPLYGIDNARVTVHWHDPPVLRPANTWTGASLLHGGDVDEGTHAYRVHRPEHWLFEGTGLVSDQEFGADEMVVDNEADGAHLVWQGGLPVPTGSDGTPPTFTILATSPASQGWATLGALEEPGRGTVFNAASITWSLGLAANETVRRITRNAFERFLGSDFHVPRAGRIVADAVVWATTDPDVVFSISLRNDSIGQVSRFAGVEITARALGGGGGRFVVDSLEVGPLLPQESVLIERRVPWILLPPSAPVRVAGTGDPVPGCTVGDPWRGEVLVTWREAGVAGTFTARAFGSSLPVCPGAAPSAIAVRVDVPQGKGAAWRFDDPPVGWSASLRVDGGGEPGGEAPDPLPAGSFAGWIAVEADPTTTGEAGVVWRWNADPDSGSVRVDAAACPCGDPSSASESVRAKGEPALRVVGREPVRGVLHLRYDVPVAGFARLRLYDVAGRLLAVLREGPHDAGSYEIIRPVGGATAPAPGRVVFATLETPGGSSARKIVLLP